MKKKTPRKGTPTEREKDVLAAIRLHRKKHGHSPTFAELGKAIGRSKECARFHCVNLRFKCLVDWIEWSPRTLRIL